MTTMTMASQLRALLSEDDMVLAPGVYDGLSARIVEDAGFAALYCSGGAVARSSGVPDLGLLTMTEVLARLREITDAVELPVIADADTGYGNALNMRRTVQEFERLNVAGIQIEDQVTPKKCGHYDAKALISTDEMLGKITAACDARACGTVLIVRTDAIAVDGLDSALERGRRYVDAGADVLFLEAPETREEIERIAAELGDTPLLINMFEGGRTPLVPAQELATLGYKIMIAPSDLQRAAIHAMQSAARVLREEGSTVALSSQMATFSARDELIHLGRWKELEQRYAG